MFFFVCLRDHHHLNRCIIINYADFRLHFLLGGERTGLKSNKNSIHPTADAPRENCVGNLRECFQFSPVNVYCGAVLNIFRLGVAARSGDDGGKCDIR